MIEKTRGRDGLNWQLPLYAGLTAFIVFIPVICKANLDVLYLFVVGPFLFLISIVWLIIATIRKKGRQFLRVLSILAVFCAVSFLLFKNSSSIRRSGRWLVWSHYYKAEVLAQPTPANGEFKHIEWDGWGFPGAGDTTVYLAFDPTDSLVVAAKSRQPGKFNGIPCKVPRVSRLEDNWYAVLFYTDERWGKVKSDCGISD